MPNRLNGIMPRSLHTFLKWCAQDGIFDQNLWIFRHFVCSEHKRKLPRKFGLPHMLDIMITMPRAAWLSADFLSQPGSLLSEELLPAYQAMMEKRIIR